MSIDGTELTVSLAAMLVIVMGGLAVVVWMTISGVAPFRETCSQCGAQLPVARRPVPANSEPLGDWTCNRCGTRFDRRGKARNQMT
jgi:hypothetical protein